MGNLFQICFMYLLWLFYSLREFLIWIWAVWIEVELIAPPVFKFYWQKFSVLIIWLFFKNKELIFGQYKSRFLVPFKSLLFSRYTVSFSIYFSLSFFLSLSLSHTHTHHNTQPHTHPNTHFSLSLCFTINVYLLKILKSLGNNV